MSVKLIWITPEPEKLLVEIARVSSNPEVAARPDHELLRYLMAHQHWSPLEMVSACFEIQTTRTVARQILRHRSFSYQEFSQRYQNVKVLETVFGEARLQDLKNRQSSLPAEDLALEEWWRGTQEFVSEIVGDLYHTALDRGIAKEVARNLLPEGLTPSRMYMSGTIRSWFHYCQVRMGEGTQKEHRLIAEDIAGELSLRLPNVFASLWGN